MKDCAPTKPIALWRARVLAFLGAALVGFVVPTGCTIAPECRPYPSRASVEGFLFGCDRGCPCGRCEASCGAPSEECAPPPPSVEPCEQAACPPPHRKFWHHLPKCKLYDPEAGIFNFCIPPQCINPPAPLPPGRFFPVPVRPAFAQRGDDGYGLLGANGYGYGDSNGNGAACDSNSCR